MNMLISVNMSVLTETKWHQYLVRFALGGVATALAGLIAKIWGPSIGGLFLALPAIFPASATLIEKHERERKENKNLNGTQRARTAVAADATGAMMGATALIGFGFVAWRMLPRHQPWTTLLCGIAIWLTMSVLIWFTRKRHVIRRLSRFLQRTYANSPSSKSGNHFEYQHDTGRHDNRDVNLWHSRR